MLVDSGNRVIHRKTYTGDDAIDKFLTHLVELGKKLSKNLNAHPDCPELTPEETLIHNRADKCHICEGAFEHDGSIADTKVRDHNHRTGLYLGAAHNDW